MRVGADKLKRVFLAVLVVWSGLCSSAAWAKDTTERNGDVLMLMIPTAGFAATIFAEKGHKGTIQFLESFAVSQAITEGLKSAIHATRPNGNCCKSFPSGHASAAFMGAAFVHRRYGWKAAVSAWAGATYVGYSRVEAEKHYTRDVAAGAAIGILSSFYFTKPYKGFQVTPVAAEGLYAVHVAKRW